MISNKLTSIKKGMTAFSNVLAMSVDMIVPVYEDCKRQHSIKNDFR